MIRPQWPSQRQCLRLCNRARGNALSPGRARHSSTSPGTKQERSLPNKKPPIASGSETAASSRDKDGDHHHCHSGGSSDGSSSSSSSDGLPETRAFSAPVATVKDDPKSMLLVTGLSPNLRIADFYRLAPGELSNWQAGIKRVQQRHSRTTLEPKGTYQISFEHSAAARSYADNLARLHRLARHRYSSPSGLWESTIPPHLLSSSSSSAYSSAVSSSSSSSSSPPPSPAEELSRYAVAPPSFPALSVTRVRTTDTNWAIALSAAVEPLGYGPRPSVVIVRAYPRGMSAGQLDHIVKSDGRAREMHWRVSRALPWSQPTGYMPRGGDGDGAAREGHAQAGQAKREQRDGPFVMAAESSWDARGFHRYWNQRVVYLKVKDGTESRFVIKTAVIEM